MKRLVRLPLFTGLCLFAAATLTMSHAHEPQWVDCESAIRCAICTSVMEEAPGHLLEEATCTEPAVCEVCGEILGEPLGHTLLPADCENPERCEVCGEIFGEPLGHTLLPADCENPERCEVCGETFGEPLGHALLPADCENPERCEVCGETFGEPLGHTLLPADCENPEQCEVCGKTFGEPLGHAFVPADCLTARSCERCGKTFGRPLGHKIIPADCEEPERCRRCGEVFAPALGHTLLPADCENPERCKVCGKTFRPAQGHRWTEQVLAVLQCTADGRIRHTCSVCQKTYDEVLPAKGHQYGGGTVCGVCGHMRVYLNAPMLYQGWQYPNGCESVSAVMALQYAGAEITVDGFIDGCLPMAPTPWYQDGVPVVESPWSYYIGDPRTSGGYYCFAPVIGVAIQKAGYACSVHIGEDLRTLCETYVANGSPLILWGTLGMSGYAAYSGRKWRLADDVRRAEAAGEDASVTVETVSYFTNLHCVLLMGYDEEYCYINDPLRGQVSCRWAAVEASFAAIGKQAVTVG